MGLLIRSDWVADEENARQKQRGAVCSEKLVVQGRDLVVCRGGVPIRTGVVGCRDEALGMAGYGFEL